MHFVQTSTLKKVSSLERWILTDDDLAIVEQSDEAPLPLNWRDFKYELVNSSVGMMRLYDLAQDRS